MAFSPDGKTFAVASGGIVRLLDLDTMDQKDVLAGHTRQVYALAFSPIGETLASGVTMAQLDCGIRIPMNYCITLVGHTEYVELLAYSRDGKMLASAGSREDNTIYLWDVHTGKLLRTITEHPSRISSICHFLG